MAPRIDVRPEAFYETGQAYAGDVCGPLVGALGRLVGTLDGCQAMAGSDPGGQAWASSYDRAARAAVLAGQDIVNGTYRLACLLERTGRNHALADAASTAGRADWHDGWWMSDESFTWSAGRPPSASGGSADTPTGWWLIEHTVGYVWPNGHQDRLHRAGGAWRSSAAALLEAAEQLSVGCIVIGAQSSPEVDDAATACMAMVDHCRALARTHSALALVCDQHAAHIDEVHAQVVDELESLLEWSAAIQVVGGLASIFSAGIAEAPTQGAQAARVAATAAKVGQLIGRFTELARAATATLPSVAAAADTIRWTLEGLLGTRVAIAGVTSVRALPPAVRAAHVAEMAATERLTLSSMTVAASKLAAHDREVISRILAGAHNRRGFYGFGKGNGGTSGSCRQNVGRSRRAARRAVMHGSARMASGSTGRAYPKTGRGAVQANLEQRHVPDGKWPINGHIDIEGRP